MKSITAELKAHLAQEITTLATCWKVKRRDATVMGFTDHDAPIVYEGVTYEATSGFSPSSIDSSSALNVDNLEMEGMLEDARITEADLLAGRYDFAQVEVFVVNYADLTQGRMVLRTGWLGEVTVRGGQFVAELRGLSQQLGARIGQQYTPGCRADLGDDRCKVDLADYTVSGAVTSVTSRSQFRDSDRSEAADYFASGTVTFTGGENAGLSMEVKEFAADGTFTLVLPMPYAVAAGDGFTAIAGCDKRFETCANRFANAVNFRGEPHVPGTDALLETASTRN